jgi:hypothetical protein
MTDFKLQGWVGGRYSSGAVHQQEQSRLPRFNFAFRFAGIIHATLAS